jgi:hypothetical protein
MAKTKYGHLIKPLPIKQGPGGANAKQLVWMLGKDLAGLNLNFALGRYDETGIWHSGHGAHTHPFDECLVFFGHDTNDLGYLGAELEISMGKEQEKHTFDVPTVVIVPAGVPHCPLVTRRVDKPFGHFHIALSRQYKVEWLPDRF